MKLGPSQRRVSSRHPREPSGGPAQHPARPHDTVVLQATSAEVLVGCLQEPGYTLPDSLPETLQASVASGQYFAALKLSSDKDAGDLRPIGMHYPATAASIPIQLTSVAAIPDLPIEIFVLGRIAPSPTSTCAPNSARRRSLGLTGWAIT